jgi:Domain of unknown function (DUF4403)
MNLRNIVLGAAAIGMAFIATILVMNLLWPTAKLQQGRPALAAVPPLQPLTGASTVLAPAAIAMTAIRDALEAQAPRNLTGKPQNPLSQLLSNADLNFTVTRGPLGVSGRADTLMIATQLSGTFQARGQITSSANALGSKLGNALGGAVGQQVQNLAGKAFDQHADIHGNVTVTSHPMIAPNWRLSPNLAGQATIADVVVPVAGLKLSVANLVKPLVDNGVRDQMSALEARLRGDPFIENAARGEWTKLCRAVALGAAGQGMPNLWLEIRPTRAIAAQPRIDANAVTLLVGVQAETRIVPTETKPNCPFPQQLDIVAQGNDGKVSIRVPIDMPFTEVNRLLEAQIKGKTFPEDGSGSFAATIRQATVAASGDRLLISLLVNIKKTGLLGLGADSTVYVWGRPMLDQQQQILRFTDIDLDVESKAAFGLFGAAAQLAMPYLQKTLAEQAVIDLKPLAADAKKRIAAAVTDFTRQSPGVSGNVAIDDLRLIGVAYDANTLRIIADATGTVSVAISSLATQ